MKIGVRILMAFLLCTGIAGADEPGFYMGAGLGKARTDLSGLDNDTDTAFQVFAGYSINKNLSAEVGYINLGEVTTKTGDSGTTTGVAVTLLGILPLQGNVALFGKFGMSGMDTEWDTTTDSRSDLTWGIGGQLDFSSTSSFRLEYNDYMVGDKNKVDGDSAVVTLSILFRP